MRSFSRFIASGLAAGLVAGLLLTACGKPQSPAGVQPTATPAPAAPVSSPNAARNLAPTIHNISILPGDPKVGDTLQAQVAVTDAENEPISLRYQWSVNGNAIIGEVQSSLAPGSFLRGDIVTCTVTPSDGLNVGAVVTSAPISIVNSPPKIVKIGYSPEFPTRATGFELQVTAEDADKDPLTITYDWFQDGKAVTDVEVNKMRGSAIKKGVYVWALVQVSDGKATVKENSMRVPTTNATPVITSKPAALAAGSNTYSYQVTAEDADGDKVAYSVAGPEGVAVSADGLLTWQPRQTQAGTHQVKVTAKDPDGASGTQTFDLTVGFHKAEPSPTP
jgi:hypothetical protein